MNVSFTHRSEHTDQVLTYPSWCVVRGQKEVPEATRALRGRILESFTDALDGTWSYRLACRVLIECAIGNDGMTVWFVYCT